MEYDLTEGATYEDIKAVLLNCLAEDVINCYSLEVFDLAKSVLIGEKLTEKTVQLLDEDDYVLQQVTSKKREEADKEAEFSRILILLMQNQGPEGCFSQYDMNLKRGKIVVDNTLAPKHSIASITKGILVDLSLALINFSFKKEKRWLKYRMQ